MSIRLRTAPTSAALGALGAAALILAALSVQHLRHGWPFALHHGLPVSSPEVGASVPDVPAGAARRRVAIELDAARAAAVGVALEQVQWESIAQPVRAGATVVPDEARVGHAHTRVAGWLEQIYVTATGQAVRAGEPLAGIFSQELFASQTEYLALRAGAAHAPASLATASGRSRLKVLGMSEAEIARIERTGTPQRLITVTAPRSGVVLRRAVATGTAVDPSTEIVTIADLSRVWVIAEVPEANSAQIVAGSTATLEFPAAGRPAFEAEVEFVQPTLSERTRTLRVRFAVDNANGALRPGLFGSAQFRVAPRKVLTVPRDAVVDTGESQHVFVASGGRYEPRTVELGTLLAGRAEVRAGLAAGEQVVVSGVFLIDSESRLRESGGTGHSGHGGTAPAPEKTEHGEHGPAP